VLISVGRSSDPVASTRVLEADSKTVVLKNCSTRRKPPKKKLIPVHRSKLPTILPVRYDLTKGMLLSVRARITTMILTACLCHFSNHPTYFGQRSYPNIPFKITPRVSPTYKATSSRAKLKRPARGIIGIRFVTKMEIGAAEM